MSYTQEETEALEKVDKYKGQLYPVGEDRAAMCHASVVLAAALRSREALLAKKEQAANLAIDAINELAYLDEKDVMRTKVHNESPVPRLYRAWRELLASHSPSEARP